MILVGELSLWVALLLAVWSALVSFAGGRLARSDLRESGERAIHAALAMLVLAFGGLLEAILSHDFSVAYVAANATANLPRLYTLGVIVAGNAGRLLVLALLLAAFSTIAIRNSREDDAGSNKSVAAMLGFCLSILLGVDCLLLNPFARLEWIPPDGSGLAPGLQSVSAALHTVLFLSASAATIVILALALDRRTPASAASPLRERILHASPWPAILWFSAIGAFLLRTFTTYRASDTGDLPVGLITALVLVGVAVGLLANRDREFHRRLGGRALLIGAALLAAGLFGANRRSEFEMQLGSGESRTVTDAWGRPWTLMSEGLSEYNVLNREATTVLLEIRRGISPAGTITSERRQLIDSRGAPTYSPFSVPGIQGSPVEDFRVSLVGILPGRRAVLTVAFIPLMRLIWIGGVLLLFAGVLAVWPTRRQTEPLAE